MFTENFPSFFRLWNPESGKNLNVESGILGWESGIPLKESGIARMIKIQNPSFTAKYWNPSTKNPEYTAWNPESKTVLDSLIWDDTLQRSDSGGKFF